MITRMKVRILLSMILVTLSIFSCQKDDDVPDGPGDTPFDPSKDEIVFARKEIRAAWIATVSNLDWPITLSNAEAQKAELIAMLDVCKALKFNAVILQIRPTADAFYPSQLEPWSRFLTGQQGINPGYDPLQFAIEESHKRGMEFHAWMNPYRIGLLSLPLTSTHIAVKNPDWAVTYGTNRYFNPGIPAVIDHLKNVIKDVITRYDVDAIHFDDFFYPYGAKSASNPFDFDDKAAWEQYGNGKDIHTWRADNVNLMVREVSELIHTQKPGVLFGISPAGRRENSLALYADPLIWLDNKWVDYLAPQIYWEFGHPTADYGQVANYWNSNARGVPMVIGIAAYKFKDPAYPAYATTSEIGMQINMVRQSINLQGCFFFRIGFFLYGELFNYLKSKYSVPSVLPMMGTPSVPPPGIPQISLTGKQISWSATGNAVKYGVYLLERNTSKANSFNATLNSISDQTSFTAETGKTYLVKAINADNAESASSNVVFVK